MRTSSIDIDNLAVYFLQAQVSTPVDALPLYCSVRQVDSGKLVVSASRSSPSSSPAVDPTGAAEGVANASSKDFDFLSATFGATLPRGHIAIVPSLPEDACSSLAPLAVVTGTAASSIGDSAGDAYGDSNTLEGRGGGDGTFVPPTAVLVKRGGCSFGVKAKNVQVWKPGPGLGWSLDRAKREGRGGTASH